jgi:hypothetical protein
VEVQDLFKDVVEVPNADLPAPVSASEPRKKQPALRDGIDWEAISKKLGTRDPKQCMAKWYRQLRPTMLDTNEWSHGDDLKLLKALWHAKPEYVRKCVCPGLSHNFVSKVT